MLNSKLSRRKGLDYQLPHCLDMNAAFICEKWNDFATQTSNRISDFKEVAAGGELWTPTRGTEHLTLQKKTSQNLNIQLFQTFSNSKKYIKKTPLESWQTQTNPLKNTTWVLKSPMNFIFQFSMCQILVQFGPRHLVEVSGHHRCNILQLQLLLQLRQTTQGGTELVATGFGGERIPGRRETKSLRDMSILKGRKFYWNGKMNMGKTYVDWKDWKTHNQVNNNKTSNTIYFSIFLVYF